MTRQRRLRWLWVRLRVMSAREVAHRLLQPVRGWLVPRAERHWPDAAHPAVMAARKSVFLVAEESQLFLPACEAFDPVTVENLLAGRLRVFGRWIDPPSSQGGWHTDPFTGVVWPLQPCDRIAYRPGNPTGDVRITWEASRLQHLFALALLGARDSRHAKVAGTLVEQHLFAWQQANPPGVGIHYLSAMEAALRLISLFHAFDLLRGQASETMRAALAELVVGHAWHIERRLSLHSSAGNHTIAEAVGLLYAGLLLPECPWAQHWKHRALDLLRTEAVRQIDADGGGIEQATWYLLFITDLLGLAQALLAHKREPPVPAMDDALRRARGFLNMIAAGPEDLPRIGDADDGFALCPELRISWQGGPCAARQQAFRTTGLSVASFSGHDRLVFLHNPLGMAPLFGHGHADCLSVLFRWQGRDLLIDPGTFQYGADQAHRRYFRSTRAHNTATVADDDQADQLTAFIWTRPYRCVLEFAELTADVVRLLARHDGYRHLGITHWRGVVYRRERYLAIWDYFEDAGDHEIRLHWHLGCDPGAVRLDDGALVLSPPGMCLQLRVDGGTSTLASGGTAPILGWRSVAYGVMTPTPTLTVAVPQAVTGPVVSILMLDGSQMNANDFTVFESHVTGKPRR